MSTLQHETGEVRPFRVISTCESSFLQSISEAGKNGEWLFLKILRQESLNEVWDMLESFLKHVCGISQHTELKMLAQAPEETNTATCFTSQFTIHSSFKLVRACIANISLPVYSSVLSLRMTLELPIGIHARKTSDSIILDLPQHDSESSLPRYCYCKGLGEDCDPKTNTYQQLLRLHIALTHIRRLCFQYFDAFWSWGEEDLNRIENLINFMMDGFQPESFEYYSSHLWKSQWISALSVYDTKLTELSSLMLLKQLLSEHFKDERHENKTNVSILSEIYIHLNSFDSQIESGPQNLQSTFPPNMCSVRRGLDWDDQVLQDLLRIRDRRDQSIGVAGNLDMLKILIEKMGDALDLRELDTAVLKRSMEDSRFTNLPVVCCLLSECDILNNLFVVIDSCFRLIRESILGREMLPAALNSRFIFAEQLLDRKVPSVWTAISYPWIGNLGEWVKDLKQRRHQVMFYVVS